MVVENKIGEDLVAIIGLINLSRIEDQGIIIRRIKASNHTIFFNVFATFGSLISYKLLQASQ
jgi:hypothetical protein